MGAGRGVRMHGLRLLGKSRGVAHRDSPSDGDAMGQAARLARARAERYARVVMWALRAISARRSRSASGRVPSGSTFSRNDARNLARPGALVAFGSLRECIA